MSPKGRNTMLYRPIQRYRISDRIVIEVSPDFAGYTVVAIVDGARMPGSHITGEITRQHLVDAINAR